MTTLKTTFAIALLVLSPASIADAKYGKYSNKHNQGAQFQHYDYARVIDVRPIYREVRVSNPVTECRDRPVTRVQHKSADGMIAGGLLGGIVGHQIGNGRGRKLATAVGAIIGAQIGHEAVNRHASSSHSQHTEYVEHCEVSHKVTYEEVIDGYRVTYQYRGERHNIEMPYDPGKRIKMRIEVTPVI